VLSALFSSAHAAISLSSCESFGIPVVEAMRAGLPAVVADEPWSAEIARDAAIRVDAHDLSEVVAGLRMLEDRAVWLERSAYGQHVASQFTWDKTAAGIAAVARDTAVRKRDPSHG
jgi:glycosyltransferase involved in cell wall biosynthesis